MEIRCLLCYNVKAKRIDQITFVTICYPGCEVDKKWQLKRSESTLKNMG